MNDIITNICFRYRMRQNPGSIASRHQGIPACVNCTFSLKRCHFTDIKDEFSK